MGRKGPRHREERVVTTCPIITKTHVLLAFLHYHTAVCVSADASFFQVRRTSLSICSWLHRARPRLRPWLSAIDCRVNSRNHCIEPVPSIPTRIGPRSVE